MKRNAGFIDLNAYFHKIKKNNNWHNYDFLLNGIIEPSMYSDSHYWLKIKGKKYYYKPTNYPYHEVLSYFLADYLGFNAVFCDLAELKSKDGRIAKGIISESFRKKNAKYISGYEILKEYYEKNPEIVKEMGLTNGWENFYEGPYFIDMNNLEIIWQALEYRYRNRPDVNIQLLMDKIIEQYKFGIITRANDKGAQNWEIEESENGVFVCPIFDNEISFHGKDTTVAFSVGFEDNEKSPKDSIRRFLSVSSREYVERFIEQFDFLELEDFLRIIFKVEKHIGSEIPEDVKKEIIASFVLNKREINEVLIELNLRNKGR